MIQDGLINRIIKTCGMDDCNPKTTQNSVQDPLETYTKGNPVE